MSEKMKDDNLTLTVLSVMSVLMLFFFNPIGLLFTFVLILFLLFKKKWKYLSGVILFLAVNFILPSLMNYSSLSSSIINHVICFWGGLCLVLLIYKQFKWVLIALVFGVIIFVSLDYSQYDLANGMSSKKILIAKELLSDDSTQQNTGSSMTDSREGTIPTTEDDNKQQEENTKE